MKKFDVIVVGAGPAGVTAALLLAQAGLEVVIFERGEYPGAKNMFGGMLYSRILHEIIPNFWEEAPWERYITRRVLTFLSHETSLSLDLESSRFGQPPYNGFTVLRSRFDRWYAQQAVAAGALLVPETVVDDLLWQDGRVVGVRTRREAGDLYADVVIAADGVNSVLARKAGLRQELSSHHVAISVKETIGLPRQVIEERFNLTGREGMSREFIGGLIEDVRGGAFLYTNQDSLSIGVVAQPLSLQEKRVPVHQLLEDFKRHPLVKGLVKDGVTREYSAHLIPEGGLHMMPRLYTDGLLVVGDAAGFTLATGLFLEGANFAIASGAAAAQTVKEAAGKGDFSRTTLARYQELLEDSFVLRDLRTFRSAPRFLENPRLYGLYPHLFSDLARQFFTVDGQPHRKLWPLLREGLRGQVSLGQLLRDGVEAGRVWLW